MNEGTRDNDSQALPPTSRELLASWFAKRSEELQRAAVRSVDRRKLKVWAQHAAFVALGFLIHHLSPYVKWLYHEYMPQHGHIVVVLDENAPHAHAILQAIRDGYGLPFGTRPSGTTPEIEAFPDGGRLTGARSLAHKLTSQEWDVVGVIGHFDSNLTKEAIQEYCRAAEPFTGDVADMPLFMPNDTAPDLVAEAHDRGCNYAYRLPPSDDSQARDAAQLARSRHFSRLALFVDQSRSFYSNGVADGIRDQLSSETEAFIVADIAFDGDAGKIVVDSSLVRMDVDMAIVIAATSGAQEILRQSRAANWWPKAFVFSDAAASSDSDVRRLSEIVRSGTPALNPGPASAGSAVDAKSIGATGTRAPPELYFLLPSENSHTYMTGKKSAFDAYYFALGKLLRRAADETGWPMTRPRFAETFARISKRSHANSEVKITFDEHGANPCVSFHCFVMKDGVALDHFEPGCAGETNEEQKECAGATAHGMIPLGDHVAEWK